MSTTLERAQKRIDKFVDYAVKYYKDKHQFHRVEVKEDDEGKRNSCGKTVTFLTDCPSACEVEASWLNIRMTSDNHVKVSFYKNSSAESEEFTSQDNSAIKQAIESLIDCVNYIEDEDYDDDYDEDPGFTLKGIRDVSFNALVPGTIIVPGIDDLDHLIKEVGIDNALLNAKVIQGKLERDEGLIVVTDYENWEPLPTMTWFPYDELIKSNAWIVELPDAE